MNVDVRVDVEDAAVPLRQQTGQKEFVVARRREVDAHGQAVAEEAGLEGHEFCPQAEPPGLVHIDL